MFDPIITNAAAVFTSIILWSTATGVFVYLYAKTRHDKIVRFLDDYIADFHVEHDQVRARLDYIEREYGHVIDDYIEMYSDGQWKLEKLEADR